MSREPTRRSSRILARARDSDALLPAVAALCYLALALPTLDAVGVTTDEWKYMYASKSYWLYYEQLLSTGHGPTSPALVERWEVNSEHPPLAKSLSALTWGTALVLNGGSLGLWESVVAHRVSTVLLAAVAIYLVGRLTAVVHSRAAGAVAAFALAFTPRFFAHSRYLALDVPVAATWVLAVWTFRRGFDDARYAAVTGVAFGLAVATKLNAFFVPVAVAAWLVVSYRRELLDRVRRVAPVDLGDPRERNAIGSLLVLTPLTVLVLWPYLWVEPVGHFEAYLRFHLDHYPIPVYYLGESYLGPGPWHYPFVMVAVTVPVSILALAIVGAGRAVRDAYTLENRDTPLLLVNALVPLVVIALPTHAYDGVRLFMPAFPFVAALSGVGAVEALRRLRVHYPGSAPSTEADRDPSVRRYAPLAVALLLVTAPGGIAYATDGPYENTYFNGLVGGGDGALEAGFEIEYWQQSYLELVPFLNERAAEEGVVRVYVPVGGEPLEMYRDGDFANRSIAELDTPGWVDRRQAGILDDDVVFVVHPSEADYYAFVTAQGHRAWDDREWRLFRCGDPAYRYTVDGAPLVQIYRLNETNRAIYQGTDAGSVCSADGR